VGHHVFRSDRERELARRRETTLSGLVGISHNSPDFPGNTSEKIFKITGNIGYYTEMKKGVILFISIMVLASLLPTQEVILYPEKPLNPKAGRILKVEEMFRITDECGEFFFEQPSGLQVADDGSIFLTDEEQLLKFAPDGTFLKNLFKKGQGPGEIQSFFYFFRLNDEKILIYDPMRTKIIHMDQEGKLIEEFRLPERYVQFIGLWKDNFVFTKYSYPGMEERTGKVFDIPGKILLISKQGDIIDGCPGISWEIFLHPKISTRIPVLVTTMTEDGKTCFISDPEEYLVSVLDLEKLEFIRKFKREYPRVKLSKRETPPSQPSIKIPEKVYKNDIVDLYNFKGNLWVETSTYDEKKGTLFDVFNRAGQYIDKFWLDVGGSLINTHGDNLFIREQNEDGNVSIVKYKVMKER
jgi:hypothetical protein